MPILKNSKHEKFAQEIASGVDAAHAYRNIYNASGLSARISSSRLMKTKPVADRIAEIKKEFAETSGWKRSEAYSILRNIALSADAKDQDRIRAVEVLNKMCGFMESEKTSVTVELPFMFPFKDQGVKKQEKLIP